MLDKFYCRLWYLPLGFMNCLSVSIETVTMQWICQCQPHKDIKIIMIIFIHLSATTSTHSLLKVDFNFVYELYVGARLSAMHRCQWVKLKDPFQTQKRLWRIISTWNGFLTIKLNCFIKSAWNYSSLYTSEVHCQCMYSTLEPSNFQITVVYKTIQIGSKYCMYPL